MNNNKLQTVFNLVTLITTVANLNDKCLMADLAPEDREISVDELSFYYAATQNALRNEAEYENFLASFCAGKQPKERGANV